jgi:hypothetical protein
MVPLQLKTKEGIFRYEILQDGKLKVQQKSGTDRREYYFLPETLFPLFTETSGGYPSFFPSIIAIVVLGIIYGLTAMLCKENPGILIFAALSTVCGLRFLWCEYKKSFSSAFVFDSSIGSGLVIFFRKKDREKAYRFVCALSRFCLKRFHHPPGNPQGRETMLQDLRNDQILTDDELAGLQKLLCPETLPDRRIGFPEAEK